MPYLFSCPNCRTQTQVDDQYSGRRGECVACGQPIQIPVFLRPGAMPSPQPQGPTSRYLGWLAAALVVAVITGSAAVAVIRSSTGSVAKIRQARTRGASIRNVEKIATALNAYASKFGTYPPPVLRDSAGEPLHSWRTLILPFLGENALYDQIDLTVPWNLGRNGVVINQTPAVYRVNELNKDSTSGCHYYLITGAGTLFPPTGPLGPGDATDGASKTLLVVEAAVSPYAGNTNWAAPEDLDAATMTGVIGAGPGEPGGVQDTGVTIATVDGLGHFVPAGLSPSVFQKLITPKSAEPLPDDILDFPEAE